MPLTLSLRELVRAFGRRLRGDATLAALVGTDAAGSVRIVHGWPKTLLEDPYEDAFPRLTYFRVATNRRTRAPEHVLLQLDEWAWPDDATGGDVIDDIDNRVLELVAPDEGVGTWFDTTDGIYLSCSAEDCADPPGTLVRRMRRLLVAPA